MRDIVVTVVMFGLLPACVQHPWIGLVVWSGFGYLNPHRLAWGFARSIPFALIVALAVFVGMLLGRDDERRSLPWVRETYLLAALWVIFTITTVFALYPGEALTQWTKVSKVLLFTFLTMVLFQKPERLRVLFIVIALSIGFYGLKGTPFIVMTGGEYRIEGPTGTFIGGNTGLGLAFAMTLPFLFHLAADEPRRWLRRLLWAGFGCSIVSTIFTYSRGALLGLLIVLFMLCVRGRRRLIGIAVIGVLVVGVMVIAPDRWMARMGTIEHYEEDMSARARLVSWRVAYELALERPLIGGGFWSLPHEEIYARYVPEDRRVNRLAQTAHSIYFSVLGDHGFPGLAVFLLLILSCFVSLWSLRRRLRGNPEAAWLVRYCSMVETSLTAYAVSGAFLTAAYFDLFYHLVSFVILFKALARAQGYVTDPVRVGPVDARAPRIATAS